MGSGIEGSFQPGFVGCADVHRALEGAGPVGPGAVVVGMGDDNGVQTAESMNSVDSGLVEERDEVPKDIAGCGLDELGSLANSKLGGSVY